ncbi:Cytosol aminopeptidase [Buchnera aphidicola (Thelaxes suberi)]|uniref:leucyl aminopeptidase n=1 Tax=Buchnera aphidicola TaxID=9 RepID=UPI003464C834
MNFITEYSNVVKKSRDCIIIGVMQIESKFIIEYKLDNSSYEYIVQHCLNAKFQAKIGQYLLLFNVPKLYYTRIFLIGCGKNILINSKNYKKIIEYSIDVFYKSNNSDIEYHLFRSQVQKKDISWKIKLIIETIFRKNYKFDLFKQKKNSDYIKNTNLIFPICNDKEQKIIENDIKYSTAFFESLNDTKNLSNLPSNICTPKYLANKAKELVEAHKNTMSIKVLNESDLKKLKMNAYLSVSQGSKQSAYMSIIEYKNNTYCKNNKPIILVGKGVTFDSGGISIKPANNMHHMKFDMSGASVVYGIMSFLGKLSLPLHVIGILATGENMISGESYKPGDIITTMSGRTVEILNTDAEGRLILCDVLSYIEKFLSPSMVIDIATLTGACVTSLGNVASGLFSNNKILQKELIYSSIESGDKIWPLPMFSEYYKQLRSYSADVTNVGMSHPGAITAACFLSLFTTKFPWAHLDIAGTAYEIQDGKNAVSTGRPMPLLAQFLFNQSRKK